MKNINLIGYKLSDGLAIIQEKHPELELEIVKVERDKYRIHESIYPIQQRIIKVVHDEKSVVIHVTDI